DEADDAEFGELVNELPESRVQAPGTTHRGGLRSIASSSRCYPHRTVSIRRQQGYRAAGTTWPGWLKRARVPAGTVRERPEIRSGLSEPPGKVAGVAEAEILIRARGLTKTFGGATAVDGIDF